MKIKTISLVITFIFISLTHLHAQRVNIYLSTDAGIGTFYYSSVPNPSEFLVGSKEKLAWSIGINMEYQIYPDLLFDTGLKFLSMGANEEHFIERFRDPSGFTNGWIYDNVKIDTRYISLPLALKYKWKRFNALLGYQVSYSLGGRYKFDNGKTFGQIPTGANIITGESSASANFTDWDYGLLTGIQFRISQKWTVHFQFYSGHKEITSDQELDERFRTIRNLTFGVNYFL